MTKSYFLCGFTAALLLLDTTLHLGPRNNADTRYLPHTIRYRADAALKWSRSTKGRTVMIRCGLCLHSQLHLACMDGLKTPSNSAISVAPCWADHRISN